MISTVVIAAAAFYQPVDAAEGKGRIAMQRYAECIGHKYRKLADIVADVDPIRLTPKQRLEVHRPDCLIGVEEELKVDPALYRFAVAEALVHREYGKAAPDVASADQIAHPILAADAPPPADWGGKPEKWPDAREQERRFSVISALGDCVVRADAILSWNLLSTRIASDAEKAAMAALAPTIGTCLPLGQKVSISRAEIRGMVALNYYRLAKATRVSETAR